MPIPSVAKGSWYAAGLSFSCTQCGNCCSGPPGHVYVTKEEIGRIASYLGRDDGCLDKAHLRRVGLRHSLTEKPNGDCTFLIRENGKTRCAIYPVRPLQCRTWPFWTKNLHSPEAWNEAHKKCPGMNKGKHYDYVQIEVVRTQQTW